MDWWCIKVEQPLARQRAQKPKLSAQFAMGWQQRGHVAGKSGARYWRCEGGKVRWMQRAFCEAACVRASTRGWHAAGAKVPSGSRSAHLA